MDSVDIILRILERSPYICLKETDGEIQIKYVHTIYIIILIARTFPQYIFETHQKPEIRRKVLKILRRVLFQTHIQEFSLRIVLSKRGSAPFFPTMLEMSLENSGL